MPSKGHWRKNLTRPGYIDKRRAYLARGLKRPSWSALLDTRIARQTLIVLFILALLFGLKWLNLPVTSHVVDGVRYVVVTDYGLDPFVEKVPVLAQTVSEFQWPWESWFGEEDITLAWPLEGTITSGFGPRTHPVTGADDFHYGIDIDSQEGTTIFAPYKGTVVTAEERGDWGLAVIIDHGRGMRTFYAHCQSILVYVGDRVNTGDAIATVGQSGLCTSPHLHFEVIRSGERVDPLLVLEDKGG